MLLNLNSLTSNLRIISSISCQRPIEQDSVSPVIEYFVKADFSGCKIAFALKLPNPSNPICMAHIYLFRFTRHLINISSVG